MAIVRIRQRMLTALLPHQGNRNFAVPKRLVGPAPPQPIYDPYLGPLPDETYVELDTVNYEFQAFQQNFNPMTLEVTGLPASLSYEIVSQTPGIMNARIFGTLGLDDGDASPYTATITVTDTVTGRTAVGTCTLTVLQVETNYLIVSDLSPDTASVRIRWRYDPAGPGSYTWTPADAPPPYDEITVAQLAPFETGPGTGVYKFHIQDDGLTPNLLADAVAQNGWYNLSVSSVSSGGLDSADDGNYTVSDAHYLRFTSTGPLAFQMSGGEVVMEMENFDENSVNTGAHALWNQLADGAAVGGQYMQSDTAAGNSNADEGPFLRFRVNFDQTGDFRPYLRHGGGDTGSNQSYYFLIVDADAAITGSTLYFTDVPTGTWAWDSNPAGFTVSTTGLKDVYILRRSPRMCFDRIVLKNTAGVPTGDGPAESPRA